MSLSRNDSDSFTWEDARLRWADQLRGQRPALGQPVALVAVGSECVFERVVCFPELALLLQLLDAGLITEDDYDAAKAKALGL